MRIELFLLLFLSLLLFKFGEAEKELKFIIEKESLNDVVNFIKEFHNKMDYTRKKDSEHIVRTAQEAIFFNRANEKNIYNRLNEKFYTKWDAQPEVFEKFQEINKKILSGYNFDKWEEQANERGKLQQKRLWHKALFLMHALYQLYNKVLSKLINKMEDPKFICEVCVDEIKELDEGKDCLKGLKALLKMLTDDNEKIGNLYNPDNFKEQKEAWIDFKAKDLFGFVDVVIIDKPKTEVKAILKNLKVDIEKLFHYHTNLNRKNTETDAAKTLISNKSLFKWYEDKKGEWLPTIKLRDILAKDYSIEMVDKQRPRAQKNWPFHMFFLDLLFEIYKIIFSQVKIKIKEKNKNVRHEVCVVVLESKCIQECVESIETIEANLVSEIEAIGVFMKDTSLGNLQEKLKGFFDKIKNDFVVELVETKAPDDAKELPETPPTPVPSAPPKPEPSAPPMPEPSAPPKPEPNFVHHVQNNVYIQHTHKKKKVMGIFGKKSANKTPQYEALFQSFVSGGLPHGQGLHVSNQISVRS